jgi:alkanesulfonate monooxygenase SsuD/methylene tetrahydromethanopterin reductase-like flavin-dependent oxidoreductase (luciferase family)
LASLYPDRVILGIGRGDSAVRTLGYRPLPTSKIEPVLQKTKGLLAGDEVDENGYKVVLRWKDRNSKVSLMYGATGPANLKIGGQVADIVMMQVGTHPAAVSWAIDHVRRGAREAGRDPSSVQISLLCGMWVSEDRKQSRNACRWAASCATNHLEDVAKGGHAGELPQVLRDVLAKQREKYDYYAGHLDSKADHSEYLSDELIDEFSINGPAEECLAKIAELKALGVDEISSAYLNGHFEQIDRVGKEIIPRLR